VERLINAGLSNIPRRNQSRERKGKNNGRNKSLRLLRKGRKEENVVWDEGRQCWFDGGKSRNMDRQGKHLKRGVLAERAYECC